MKKIIIGVIGLGLVLGGCYTIGENSGNSSGTTNTHQITYSYDHELYDYLQNELTKGESYYDCQYIEQAYGYGPTETDKIQNKLYEAYDKESTFNKVIRDGVIPYYSTDGEENSLEDIAKKWKDTQFPNVDKVTVNKLVNILNYAKHN